MVGIIRISSFAAEDASTKSPAQWVALLGSDHLAERDAASAALLVLGARAREEVRLALNSGDPEVKARAQELWRTLQWDVIPGAEQETAALIAALEKKSDTGAGDTISNDQVKAWQDFVDRQGAQSLLLIAVFRRSGRTAPKYAMGTRMLLQRASPEDIADFIRHAQDASDRAELESAFDDIAPDDNEPKIEAGMTQLLVALGDYGKAFEFGRTAGSQPGRERNDALDSACATAVDRGDLFDKMAADGLRDIAAEKDASKACSRLAFHVELMNALHKTDGVPPLCDAIKVDAAQADTVTLPRLVKALEDAGLPALAVKMLANAKTPVQLYLRSHANAAARDAKAAAGDLRQAQTAADAITDAEEKKGAWYGIADQMEDWADPQAEALWRKILAMPPHDADVYDANACLQLAPLLEGKKQYAEAADYYEKALDLAKKMGGAMIIDDNDGSFASPEDYLRSKIKALRARAGKANPSPSPAGAGTPSPGQA